MKKNPHMMVRKIYAGCLSAPHPRMREAIWQCQYCELRGTYEEIRATPCTFVYPPCKHCGQAPECAVDCPGIMAILFDPRIHVIK